MIYMESCVILQSGKAAAWSELEKDMVPVVEKVGMKLVGSWTTAIGNTNEVTLLYSSEDMGKLQKAAEALMLNKEYQAWGQKANSIIVSHTRKIMMPLPTSPLK